MPREPSGTGPNSNSAHVKEMAWEAMFKELTDQL